jgi:hypothetical protein
MEAAHPDFWRKYVGRTGVVVGISPVSASRPLPKTCMPTLASRLIASRMPSRCWSTALRTGLSRHCPTTSCQAQEMAVTIAHAPFDLVMFDLDGTLIETAPEIADATNDTLAQFGLPAVTQQQVNDWIGHGTRTLLMQALSVCAR